MQRLKTVICWLAMASMINAGDVWLITPAGYYVTALDADGVPITTLAIGVTGHQFMGAPTDPIDPPTDPPVDPLPPAEDEWGLMAISEAEAEKVVGDPNRDETAAKVGIAYVEVGKLVIDGKIPEGALMASLQLAFNAAVGDSKEFWQPWKDKMDDTRNAMNWTNADDAGQSLIDIGLGAINSVEQQQLNAVVYPALGDWITFFREVLLPLILSLRDLFNAESAAAIVRRT